MEHSHLMCRLVLCSSVHFAAFALPFSTNTHIICFSVQMDEFTPEAVSKVSKACTSICMWVRAMYVYHNVALQVRVRGEGCLSGSILGATWPFW